MAVTTEVIGRERKLYIIDSDMERFTKRYGMDLGMNLVFFYTNVVTTRDDREIRMMYPERTYYTYRRILIRDGFLTLDDFRAKGGGTARWYG